MLVASDGERAWLPVHLLVSAQIFIGSSIEM
jgi:hypothetical protein